MAPSRPSQFNLQLQQLREREEGVKNAIETSDLLLRARDGESTKRLKDLSNIAMSQHKRMAETGFTSGASLPQDSMSRSARIMNFGTGPGSIATSKNFEDADIKSPFTKT